MDEFLSEISIMKSISRHPNVVSLIGYCTVKAPMLIIMEYVGCGDLLNYLRRLREQHELRVAAAMAVARRSEHPMRQFAGSKISEKSTSSTLQLLSQNTSVSTNGAKNTSGNDVTNENNPISVTTLKKLDQEMNYLELCYSS